MFSSAAVTHYYPETETQLLNNLTPLKSFTGRMGKNNTVPLLLNNGICKIRAGQCILWSLLFLTCFSLNTRTSVWKENVYLKRNTQEALLFLSCLIIN